MNLLLKINVERDRRPNVEWWGGSEVGRWESGEVRRWEVPGFIHRWGIQDEFQISSFCF